MALYAIFFLRILRRKLHVFKIIEAESYISDGLVKFTP